MASLKARSAATAQPRTTTLSTKKQSIPNEHARKKRKGAGSTHRRLRRRRVQKPRRGARNRASPLGGSGGRRPHTPTTPAGRTLRRSLEAEPGDQVTAPGALASTSKVEVLQPPPAEQAQIR
jgi:hypothetical protein